MSEKNLLETLFKLTRFLKRQMDYTIEKMELGIAPMHLRVLLMIHHHPNATAMDVAQRLNRDKSQVTRLLNTLIEQGLLQKRPNPADKRSQLLVFTPAGERVIETVSHLFEELSSELSAGISADEQKVFYKVLNQIIANLDPGRKSGIQNRSDL